jgi:signal transduction histidine kinase
MKMHSIRNRLIIGTSSVIMIALATGALLVYQSVSRSLYDEIDKDLAQTMTHQSLELEIIEGEVFHEWLEDIKKDEKRRAGELMQAWGIASDEVLRSPALKGSDLPMVYGKFGDRYFANHVLPDGAHVRVIGGLIYPRIESLGAGGVVIIPENLPYIMAIGRDTKALHVALNRLILELFAGLLCAIFFSFSVVSFIIRSSLKPLLQLEKEITAIDVNNPKEVFEIPADLPVELSALTHQYRELLSRISGVRQRERDFSANVAHEIRTPLAGIEATLELALANDRQLEDYKERIGETLKIAMKMRTLVNRLMWFSRLQNRTEHTESTEVDLHQLIQFQLAILSESITARGLSVKEDLQTSAVFKTDETLLSILMNNLIGNAVAHSDEQSLIAVRTYDEGRCLVFEVSNAAKGFEGETLDAIFEPFYRRDSARSANDEHSGIGLALSREIASVLGLKLSVQLKTENVFSVKVIFPEE